MGGKIFFDSKACGGTYIYVSVCVLKCACEGAQKPCRGLLQQNIETQKGQQKKNKASQ